MENLLTTSSRPAAQFSISNTEPSRTRRVANTLVAGSAWLGVSYLAYDNIGWYPGLVEATSGFMFSSTLATGHNRVRYMVGAFAMAIGGGIFSSLISFQLKPNHINPDTGNRSHITLPPKADGANLDAPTRNREIRNGHRFTPLDLSRE